MRIRVDVNNIIKGRGFCGVFENEMLESDIDVRNRLDVWKLEQEEKTKSGLGWGWCARVILKDDYKAEYSPILIEEFDDTDPMTGLVTTYCRLDKEYTYQETDLTVEQQDELAEIEEDEVTLEQIKQAVSIINGWTQLSDINIDFLKKFFKYLIKKSI